MCCLTHGRKLVYFQAVVRSHKERFWKGQWWTVWNRQATLLKNNIYSFLVPEISIRGRRGGAANCQYNLLHAITCKGKRSPEMRKPESAPLLNPVPVIGLFLKAFLLHSLGLRFHHNTQGQAGWPCAVLRIIIFLLFFSPERDKLFTSWRCT